MYQNCKYRDVVNEYKKGNISKKSKISDIIGHCYYQLTNYKKAILYLKVSLTYMPKDYNANFFLAISYKMLNKNHEAIYQFLNCLKLKITRADEVLDHLLPLVTKMNDLLRAKKFSEK